MSMSARDTATPLLQGAGELSDLVVREGWQRPGRICVLGLVHSGDEAGERLRHTADSEPGEDQEAERERDRGDDEMPAHVERRRERLGLGLTDRDAERHRGERSEREDVDPTCNLHAVRCVAGVAAATQIATLADRLGQHLVVVGRPHQTLGPGRSDDVPTAVDDLVGADRSLDAEQLEQARLSRVDGSAGVACQPATNVDRSEEDQVTVRATLFPTELRHDRAGLLQGRIH